MDIEKIARSYNGQGLNGVLYVNASTLIADADYKVLSDRLKQQKNGWY